MLLSTFYLAHLNSLIIVEDARVKADIYTIRSQVDGQVTRSEYYLKGQEFMRDTLVVAIDEAEVAAELDVLAAQQRELIHQRDLLIQEMEISHRKLDIDLEADQLEFEQVQELEKKQSIIVSESQQEFARVKQLQRAGLATEKDLSIADFQLNSHQRDLKISQLEIQKILLQLRKQRLKKEQLNIQHKKVFSVTEKLSALEMRKKQLILKMDNYRYFAPATGVLDEVFVLPGEHVSKGERLFLLHSKESIRVVANILESDIRHIAIGDSATVSFDAYQEASYQAKVSKISTLTQSQKAVVAPTQIISNFIKVSQRVEVELILEQNELMIVPGMMSKVIFEK
ncbi:HlyD family secretion protein [Alteromonas sp. H39]|uniref:HlyD family secretion protein n=1 Tax=Alteromonas sp. H39 TaxID=3389876 RepID=UPI0039DFAD07